MSMPFDREPSAVERLLFGRTLQSPPPALRSRVLAAVDEVIKEVPAAEVGKKRQERCSFSADVAAGTFLMATAVSLLFVMTLSRQAAVQRSGPATDRPPISFVRRAEAAGITLDLDGLAVERPAKVRPSDAVGPRRGDVLHVLDARSLLMGDL